MAKSDLEKLIERLVLQAKLGLGFNYGYEGFRGLDLGSSDSNMNYSSPLMRFLMLQNLFRKRPAVSRYYPAYRPIRRLNGIMYYRL